MALSGGTAGVAVAIARATSTRCGLALSGKTAKDPVSTGRPIPALTVGTVTEVVTTGSDPCDYSVPRV